SPRGVLRNVLDRVVEGSAVDRASARQRRLARPQSAIDRFTQGRDAPRRNEAVDAETAVRVDCLAQRNRRERAGFELPRGVGPGRRSTGFAGRRRRRARCAKRPRSEPREATFYRRIPPEAVRPRERVDGLQELSARLECIAESDGALGIETVRDDLLADRCGALARAGLRKREQAMEDSPDRRRLQARRSGRRQLPATAAGRDAYPDRVPLTIRSCASSSARARSSSTRRIASCTAPTLARPS